MSWSSLLTFGNLVLSSAIVILAFAELIYMVTHNLRSDVARGFCALLACVLIAYGGDIIVPRVTVAGATNGWLRAQWLGIAFVPAAYLHFTDALLRTTNARSRRRRTVVVGSYVLSTVVFILAATTDLVVFDGQFAPPVSHLAPGVLFWLFLGYYVLTALYGVWNLYRAWRRCLTDTSRRRVAYLGVSFAAPGLGVFPYLIISGTGGLISHDAVLFLSLAGNVGVAAMLVVMAYSVAYYGVLTPDRVVKHSFVHFLLRGPFVAICVIIVMLVIPKVEEVLGLPRDTVMVFAVVGAIVFLQLLINVAKPWIDRFIYRQDREEIIWIQELDRRLLTSSDLRQFLHNALIALCDLLRVNQAFIIVPDAQGVKIAAATGRSDGFDDLLQNEQMIGLLARAENNGSPHTNAAHHVEVEGFRVWPLTGTTMDRPIGLLGVERPEVQAPTEQEEMVIASILGQAEAALEDRYLQQDVFAALRHIIPEIEQIQQVQGQIQYVGSPVFGMRTSEGALAMQPQFRQWVRDALRHYWGGPNLARSPLLGLRTVGQLLDEHDDNQVRALRAVLRRAMERLRPDDGDRRMTAPEWLLYNILELRFVQRRRVREIARNLAMSESDLYRKQRLAIDEVARALAEMEINGVQPDDRIAVSPSGESET